MSITLNQLAADTDINRSTLKRWIARKIIAPPTYKIVKGRSVATFVLPLDQLETLAELKQFATRLKSASNRMPHEEAKKIIIKDIQERREEDD